MSKICPGCQASNPDSAKFCSQCGASLPEAAEAEEAKESRKETVSEQPGPEKVSEKKPAKSKGGTFDIVRSACVLFFSILLLIFSFLPVTTARVDALMDTPLDVQFGLADFGKFAIDTFFEDYDEADLADSLIGEQMEDLQEDILERLGDKDEDDSLSYKEEHLLSSLLKLTIRSELRLKETFGYGNKQMPIFISLFCSLCQMVISLAFLISSAKNLSCVLHGKTAPSRSLLKGVSFLLPISVLNIFFAKKLITALLAEDVGGDEILTAGVAKWTVVLCVAVLLFYIIPCLIDTFKTSVGTWIARFAAAFLAVLMLVSLSFVTLNAKVTGVFSSSSTSSKATKERTESAPFGIEYYLKLGVSEDELEFMRWKSSLDPSDYTKSEIAKGEANEDIAAVGMSYLTDEGENSFLLFFKYNYFLVFIFGLLLSELVAKCLLALATGKSAKGLMTWNTICLIFGVIVLIMTLALILITNVNATKTLSFAIGNAPIFGVILPALLYLTSLFKMLDKKKG